MKKILLSGMIGNGLEWYDYALYGHMAVVIGQLFFPSGDATLQLLASYGAFAVGFVARPFGGIVFGWIGDRYGRRRALTLSMIMMAVCTGAIGLMPTYAALGIIAPILLVLVRIIQGLSLGGEFSGAMIYMVEHAPPHRRGLVGSASMFSLVLGFLSGSLVATGTAQYLGDEAFAEWGWRAPFLLGVLICLVGFYIRSHCDESPVYQQARQENLLSGTPVRESFQQHWRAMLRALGVYVMVTLPFYMASIYFIAFNKQHLGMGFAEAMSINSICMLAMLVAVPISGWLSDRFGRRRLLLLAAGLFLCGSFPLFQLMEAANTTWLILAQLAFSLLVGFTIGPVPALLVELFPTRIRYTGMAIAYNVAAAVFGGTAPMVSLWLVNHYGVQALALYISLAAAAAWLALAKYKDFAHKPL